MVKRDKKMEESQKAPSAEGAAFLQRLTPDEKKALFDGRIQVDKDSALIKTPAGAEGANLK